ncbi:MAG TPA: T9SS type A sorting domain-containing protein [Xanthomarina sp.]|nr:T9SS type A sorting domain-containing protein [Xanthomarina sp.]
MPVISGTTYLIEWDDANNSDSFDFELSLDIPCPDPTNFSVGIVTHNTASFSWNAVAEASNGYVLEVFTENSDPEVDSPIYTENIPFGILTTTASPLNPQTIYDVYLTADCDVDGLSNYIVKSFETDVAPPICGGIFSDSGGASGSYLPNETIITTITPNISSDVVTVTFTYVDIETSSGNGNQDGCWDYLTVFNGPDTTYPVLAQTLCSEESSGGPIPIVPSSVLSVGMSFTSTDASGALTFVFTSDSSVQNTGWLADVTCAPLSLDEVSLSQFHFYPNPTTGKLYIKAKQTIDSVKVISLLGQELSDFYPGTRDAILDLSNLSQGTYLLQISISGQIKSIRIIKK